MSQSPSADARPFGVYIHFPYCAARCPYCDFAIAVRRTVHHDRYLAAIRAELHAKQSLFAGRRAVSVYFGGGTPSLWQPACVAAALAEVLRAFPPPAGVDPEVTLEGDPAELSAGADGLRQLVAAGVNRLSLGAQSFSPRHLQVLGRRHGPAQIGQAVANARDAGLANLSLDLMIGLVGQRRRELDTDLARLVGLRPEHVSLYQLTVEPRTPLGAWVRRGEAAAPDPERQAAAYERVRELLADAGYRQYEVSNFARRDPDRDLRSRHNSIYWTGGEYLGLGVGAHSFRRLQDGSGERFANARGLDPYLSLWAPAPGSRLPPASFTPAEGAPGLSLHESRSPADLCREAVWLGLRRTDGISCSRFAADFGVDPRQAYADAVDAMQRRGWLSVEGDLLRLTPAGVLFADEVGAAFL